MIHTSDSEVRSADAVERYKGDVVDEFFVLLSADVRFKMSNSNPDFQLYRYDPSLAAAIIFTVLFLVVSLIHTYQLIRTRTWYFIPFTIGGHCTYFIA